MKCTRKIFINANQLVLRGFLCLGSDSGRMTITFIYVPPRICT